MRVLILSDNPEQVPEWAAALRDLDHHPLVIPLVNSTEEYFTVMRSAVARAQVLLVEYQTPTLSEIDAFLCGYAEALGVQVLLISDWSGSVVESNPRNVRYGSFAEACDGYFSTGRSMEGKKALK